MEHAKRRAAILHEALPYIQKFSGKTVLIKYGGHAMVDPDLQQSFARDVVLLKQIGVNPVVVHGGGPQIGEFLQKLDIPSRFVGGQRITDDETMSVVEMVLVGKVNKEIVNMIQTAGGKAVGLSGKDGGLVVATRMKLEQESPDDAPPEIIDIGKVGQITKINPEVIESVESSGFIAVIAPVGRSRDGETLNINADTVAGELAAALGAEKLILLTDVPGVKSSDGWVQSLGVDAIAKLAEAGDVTGGMIPKLDCAANAVKGGVPEVHILDGRVPNVVLLELFTDEGVGTMITRGNDLKVRADA